MHELSIAHNLVDIATHAAQSEGASRVRKVHLRLGLMSGVVQEALLFTYDIAVADTPLEGSELVIESVPIVIYCPQCALERTLSTMQLFQCPECGTPSADIRQGKEIEISTLELEYET